MDYDAERELLTGEAVALQLRASSVILRAAGAAIDYLVYVVGTGLLVWLLLETAPSLGVPENLYAAVAISSAVLGLVIVPAVVETASQGKSLGRWALGDRIVRDDGGAVSFRHAFIRSFVGLFEIVLTLGGAAVMIAMLNARAKRLGDLIAGTYSQYERIARIAPRTFGVPGSLADWAETADVARLPDVLSRRIAQFLAQAGGHTPATRQRLAAALARDAAVFVSPVPDADPELFLAAVAVLRREREARALDLERARLEQLAPTLGALPHGFPDRG
ncbi:RDD family protein [Microcella alkalica]